jgi:hypothetical protein
MSLLIFRVSSLNGERFFRVRSFFGLIFNLQFPIQKIHNDVLHQNAKAKTISGRNVRRTVEVETELLRRATSDLLSTYPLKVF